MNISRRHDIDALRALAFALVILYHVGMYYVAGWHWHLKSPDAVDWLQAPMRAVNLWRMDLVFLISGVALGFLQRGATPARLLRLRTWRLMLPLAFGMLVIVPCQPYAQAVANGSTPPGFGAFLLKYFSGGPWPRNAFDGADFGITWNHLWYLPYLWFYTVGVLVLAPLLRSAPGQRLRDAFTGLRGVPFIVFPALPLVLAAVVLRPHFPPTHDLVHDWWLHATYFTVFLYGLWIGVDAGWWREAQRLRRTALLLAAALLAVLLLAPPVSEVRALAGSLYLWCALVAILGFAHRHLNRPWRWLPWANESVYPWYVLHQTIIIVLVTWLAPLNLRTPVEALLLVSGTVAGCWLLTALVRRSAWLRPLFGLKPRARPRRPSPALPAGPAAHSA